MATPVRYRDWMQRQARARAYEEWTLIWICAMAMASALMFGSWR